MLQQACLESVVLDFDFQWYPTYLTFADKPADFYFSVQDQQVSSCFTLAPVSF